MPPGDRFHGDAAHAQCLCESLKEYFVLNYWLILDWFGVAVLHYLFIVTIGRHKIMRKFYDKTVKNRTGIVEEMQIRLLELGID